MGNSSLVFFNSGKRWSKFLRINNSYYLTDIIRLVNTTLILKIITDSFIPIGPMCYLVYFPYTVSFSPVYPCTKAVGQHCSKYPGPVGLGWAKVLSTQRLPAKRNGQRAMERSNFMKGKWMLWSESAIIIYFLIFVIQNAVLHCCTIRVLSFLVNTKFWVWKHVKYWILFAKGLLLCYGSDADFLQLVWWG